MDTSYFLKTLGIPELQRSGGYAVRLKVRKHLALLIYLAVDYRGAHRREELVDLLWGGVPPERGRHSLSVALSVLRSALGNEAIDASTSHVRLLKDQITVDLDLLSRGQVLFGQGRSSLEVDRFLLDFEITDSSEFQHWRDRQQAQLLPTIQAGILTLADHARRSGDMSGMLVLAERLLALDPLGEEGINAKMQALAMLGDRVSALRAFELWKEELGTQLGASPSEMVAGLASRLRRKPIEVLPRLAGPGVQTDHWADRQFVGRTAEFRILSEAWESATQLDARHVLITGETGIGKSTLAMRFGTAARLEGAAVARVQCFELEQRVAFGMIGALVTNLLDRPGAVATAPDSLADIARVVPKVRERFPNLPLPRQGDGEVARLHFAEGVFALFDSIMDEQALLLLIDDYSSSDEASLAVLHMLLRRVGADRLMMILTSRPPEPGESAQAMRIRKGVSYLPMHHIELPPLSEGESAEMLAGVLRGAGKEPIPPIRRAIIRASAGSPMALDLLAQDWAAHGDLALALSLPAMQTDMPASALEAVGYDRLIERMLPVLTPLTRTALYLAVILGPRLNDLEYFSVVDLSPSQAIAALAELVTRRVLRDVGPGLEFTNELVRARLYLKIPCSARTRLHDAVTTLLLSAASAGVPVPGLEIAWHAIRARRREEATEFLISGASEAIAHGAPDEAARALSTALGHLTDCSKEEATLLLAEAYQEMAEWEAALECVRELDNGHRVNHHIRDMAIVLATESRSQLGQLSPEELPTALESVLQVANHARSASLRIRAAYFGARIANTHGMPSHIAAACSAIDDLRIEDLEDNDAGNALLVRALRDYFNRENDKGLGRVRSAAKLLTNAGVSNTMFVQIHIGLGAIACANGEYLEGIEPLTTAYHTARRLDHPDHACQAALNLALCHLRLGESNESVKWARISHDNSGRTGKQSYQRVMSVAYHALALSANGQKRDTMNVLDQLTRLRREAVRPWIRQSAMVMEADANWLLGKRAKAFSLAEEALHLSKEPLAIGIAGALARWLTLLMIKNGKPREAWNGLWTAGPHLQKLDALDRATVLCSRFHLGRFMQMETEEAARDARIALTNLPAACSEQLRDLGLLLPD